MLSIHPGRIGVQIANPGKRGQVVVQEKTYEKLPSHSRWGLRRSTRQSQNILSFGSKRRHYTSLGYKNLNL